MKLEPVYCDMHIHTYPDANRRIGYKYNASSLVDKVLLHAKGHKALISLTDHNTINKEAYNDIISSGNESIALIVGVELHVRSNGIRPYHAHAYFDADPSDGQFIDEINAVLDELYDDKLPSKENENIPTLPELLNSFRSYSFLFLPHGGQSHSTFDNALSENELCDDLMMRSAYYNTFDGFTARSGSNVGKTKKYFEKLGISEFTNLLTGSDNYCPERYPEPKAEDAEGFSPTWIYADASFDGLRLALSESSRLFYDVTPPESFAVTAPSIERVTLANDLIDIDIDLMPGLNVVIGSSSTGKTLLLEALARSTGALRLEDGNSFYNKFEIDDIVVA